MNNEGASCSFSLDNRMEKNYRRLQAAFTKYMRENDCKPSEARSHLIGELNVSLEKCLDLKIQDIGNVEEDKGCLYFVKTNQSIPFEFNVLSAGEKEVVDILLDIYLRREVYDDTIFLIDEPELHIHSSVQRKLLIEIEKMIDDNCQLWITTHSLGFMRALQNDLHDKSSVVFLDNPHKFYVEKVTKTPMKMTSKTWRNVFSIALDDMASLIVPRKIVYCEGRGEPKNTSIERGFDAKIYNEIFGEKYSDTIFVSSGGNTELDYRSIIGISILNKIIPNIEVLVLKDRDCGSGKYVSNEERIVYLDTNPEYFRMLNRWEIENYLFDKDVLKSYCADKKLHFDEKVYDDKIAILETSIKDSVALIKNICGIKTSINSEHFKLILSPYLKEGMPAYQELESCIFG